MKIGIVILNYNDAQNSIKTALSLKPYNLDKIVIVDNHSTDDSLDQLKTLETHPDIEIIESKKNGGYSYGNNIGLRYLVEDCKFDIAIIINPDVILQPNNITNIKQFMIDNPECGLVSPIMLNREGKTTLMWLRLPTYINSILDCSIIGRQINKKIRGSHIQLSDMALQVDILPGSFLAFRSNTLKDMDYLDENVFLFYEENIIGEKLKKLGIKTYLLPYDSYIHNHSTTIKKNLSILNTFKHNLKSKFYYEETYHNIGLFRKAILKILMKYAVFEMRIILKVKSLLKRSSKSDF